MGKFRRADGWLFYFLDEDDAHLDEKIKWYLPRIWKTIELKTFNLNDPKSKYFLSDGDRKHIFNRTAEAFIRAFYGGAFEKDPKDVWKQYFILKCIAQYAGNLSKDHRKGPEDPVVSKEFHPDGILNWKNQNGITLLKEVKQRILSKLRDRPPTDLDFIEQEIWSGFYEKSRRGYFDGWRKERIRVYLLGIVNKQCAGFVNWLKKDRKRALLREGHDVESDNEDDLVEDRFKTLEFLELDRRLKSEFWKSPECRYEDKEFWKASRGLGHTVFLVTYGHGLDFNETAQMFRETPKKTLTIGEVRGRYQRVLRKFREKLVEFGFVKDYPLPKYPDPAIKKICSPSAWFDGKTKIPDKSPHMRLHDKYLTLNFREEIRSYKAFFKGHKDLINKLRKLQMEYSKEHFACVRCGQIEKRQWAIEKNGLLYCPLCWWAYPLKIKSIPTWTRDYFSTDNLKKFKKYHAVSSISRTIYIEGEM